jgi:hypothetical protein
MVYRVFWGKDNYDIDVLLRPVPDHPDVKYLATEHIVTLKSLGYMPTVLLVRKEYEVLYETLRSYKEIRDPLLPACGRGGVVIAGQPGIGKHLSLTVFSFGNKCYLTELPI